MGNDLAYVGGFAKIQTCPSRTRRDFISTDLEIHRPGSVAFATLRGATLVLVGFQHGHMCSLATEVPHDGGTLVQFAFQHSHAFLHLRVCIEALIEFTGDAFEFDGEVGDLGLHRHGTRFVLTSSLQRFLGRLQLLSQSLHQRGLFADS